MHQAVVAGTLDRQGGLVPENACYAAAPSAARVEFEPNAPSGGFESGADSADEALPEIVGERSAAPPPTPPDAPAAMNEQVLVSWSLLDLVGVPGLGRLLSAVQRTAG